MLAAGPQVFAMPFGHPPSTGSATREIGGERARQRRSGSQIRPPAKRNRRHFRITGGSVCLTLLAPPDIVTRNVAPSLAVEGESPHYAKYLCVVLRGLYPGCGCQS